MKTLATLLFLAAIGICQAQNFSGRTTNRSITTFPVLQITPDARSAGMSDVGTATSADAYSLFHNPAKMGFIDSSLHISANYTPWIRQLVPSINLYSASSCFELNEKISIGIGFNYFDIGGAAPSSLNEKAKEMVFNVAGSYQLNDKWVVGATGKYIYSNLYFISSGPFSPVTFLTRESPAIDIGVYRQSQLKEIAQTNVRWAFATVIQNIGGRQNKTEMDYRLFMPTQLKVGSRADILLNNTPIEFSFVGEITKELTPTLPIYLTDSSGQPVTDNNGNYIVAAGKDPNRSAANAIFTSFVDASGMPILDENGFPVHKTGTTYEIKKGSQLKEELREIIFSMGTEIAWKQWLTTRFGFFNEHQTKGNRKYITLGLGMEYKIANIGFSYLIPTYFNTSIVQRSPLQNTFRVSAGVKL